jgi:3-oxoacyl-[acyl-carrier-protein] synthase-1
MMQPVRLSHFAIATCLGAGIEPTVEALKAGRSGLRPREFPGGVTTWAGEVDGLDNVRLSGDLAAFDCRNNRLAMFTLAQNGFTSAIERAKRTYGSSRIGVFLGSSTSGMEQTEIAYRDRDPTTGALPTTYHYDETHNMFSLARLLGRVLSIDGPAVVVSAACATTAKAFGNAARMMAAGFCDAAIVGGADTLCGTTVYGFHSLGLVSKAPCRPYDAGRDGISIGEGAGFALVEKADAEPAGGVMLLGVGESTDAYHMSSPEPEGRGARLAMERALASAGLQAGDIGYVNLHGTATPVGDAAEDRAISGLLGTSTPCSSTKSFTGHTLGAAGIVETIFASLALMHGFMPGSPHTRERDPALNSNYLVEGRAARLERVMSNSFGFGGSNCSLILGRAA